MRGGMKVVWAFIKQKIEICCCCCRFYFYFFGGSFEKSLPTFSWKLSVGQLREREAEWSSARKSPPFLFLLLLIFSAGLSLDPSFSVHVCTHVPFTIFLNSIRFLAQQGNSISQADALNIHPSSLIRLNTHVLDPLRLMRPSDRFMKLGHFLGIKKKKKSHATWAMQSIVVVPPPPTVIYNMYTHFKPVFL